MLIFVYEVMQYYFSMKNLKHDEAGLIPLLLTVLIVVIVLIVYVFSRVNSAT